MEKEQDEILQKDRSVRACISSGYRLYMSNFRRIFRYSWVSAIVYAIVNSFCGTLMITHPELTIVSLLLLIIVNALFISNGFAVLKQHQDTGSIGWPPRWFSLNTHIFIRTLKAWCCTLLIGIVTSCILVATGIAAANYLSNYTAIGCFSLVALLIFIFTLPLAYTNTRYVLNEIGYWRNLKERYGIGMRRWGYIFLITFITTLIESVCAVITSFPAIILSIAANEANAGFLAGDPYNMPSYIGWLAATVFLIIGFIQAYIILSFLFPIYYMYGAIDTHENEKKNFNKSAI